MPLPDAFSPVHSYVLGAGSLGMALHVLVRPRHEYARFGLPLEQQQQQQQPRAAPTKHADEGAVSPLIYLKSLREASYGLALIALQYQGNAAAVTTVAAVTALVALGDGLVVWLKGGRGRRDKVWGHWVAGAGLGGWAAWRAFRTYGEVAAFHALHV